MISKHWVRGTTVRAVSTSIAVVALMSSILTVGLSNVAGAATTTGTFPTGTEPLDVALNPAGTFAYAANFSSNIVSVIALSTNAVVATCSGRHQPESSHRGPDG